jgi:hypothetical protein
VDSDSLPDSIKQQLKAGKLDLNDPADTVALLKLNAVVGVTGFFDQDGKLRSVGLQCAFCHSTVGDSFAPRIGKRLDGWANRDLNVGLIVSLAPNLKPLTDLLGVDADTVKKVLNSWGPGRFDAELDKDGKAMRPDGKQAGTLIPPAFGLAGVNLHTWTGFGSVPYWNSYVAATELNGSGTFFDARLSNKEQYPVAARSGAYNARGKPDLITAKLAALHFYQLAVPAPTPPSGTLTRKMQRRAKYSSTTRRTVRVAMSRPYSPSRETTFIRQPRSVWTLFRRIDRRPTCIEPHRWRVSGPTRKAVSTMTVASRRCGM